MAVRRQPGNGTAAYGKDFLNAQNPDNYKVLQWLNYGTFGEQISGFRNVDYKTDWLYGA